MERTTLRVETPDGEYPIHFDVGLLNGLGATAGEYGLNGRCAIITNTTLAPIYGERLRSTLSNAIMFVMPEGERYKTLDTVRDLYQQLIASETDRKTTVIALGGGVVGDTAGFVAATYLRGVSFVQIPTSLLAMVDSSVGGKVGVDMPEGKNLIGAFKWPACILVDPNVLKTLPPREVRCGLAEMIKHGLIADSGLLDAMMSLYDHGLSDEQLALALGDLVPRAVQVKIDIVEQDPFEENVRAYLNLGHTFAHAVEQVSGYQWPHGEAVGVGLVAAARLSHRLGLCDAALAERVEVIVSRVGLPTRIGDLDPELLYAAMGTDKKWRGGKNRFVLLREMEAPEIVEGVDVGEVINVLKGMQ